MGIRAGNLLQYRFGSQPCGRFPVIGIETVTAPWILGQPVNQSGTQRIAVDIAGQTQKIGVVFNDDAFKSSLKQMPALIIHQVEFACIAGAEPLHGPGQIGLTGFQQQMVMVAHQHIGMHLQIVSFGKRGQ